MASDPVRRHQGGHRDRQHIDRETDPDFAGRMLQQLAQSVLGKSPRYEVNLFLCHGPQSTAS